ncbi:MULTISPECIES: hypothetical protein [Bradyrhizobium]|uniref:hypothetical protein n=1 Tax=Bradyrhizobium TaxID=374 RepID=UPI00155F3404|nr:MULTISPECIES: hypothetical protein [Bradyrhizobium]UUO32295.1 hypothetical protein DCG74_36645 [Bradyrhizobium sp. WBAH42]
MASAIAHLQKNRSYQAVSQLIRAMPRWGAHADYSESTIAWSELKKEKQESKASWQKKKLNEEVAARMTLGQLLARDPNSEIRGWFDQIALRADPTWLPPKKAVQAVG